MSDIEIYKFGGTSGATREALNYCLQHLQKNKAPKVAVFSAVAGQTNRLIKGADEQIISGQFPNKQFDEISDAFLVPFGHIPICRDIIRTAMDDLEKRISFYNYEEVQSLENKKDLTEEEKNYIQNIKDSHIANCAAFGEWTMEDLVPIFFEENNVPIRKIKAERLFRFKGNPRKGQIMDISAHLIREALLEDYFDGITILGGYYALGPNGEYMVLNRGGSDETKAYIANVINAKVAYNCTDVDGVKSIDPRLLTTDERISLKSFDYLSYQEMQELSRQGAKVLYSGCIERLMEKNIPLHIISTFDLDSKGTEVGPMKDETPKAKAVTGKKDNFVTLGLRTGHMQGQSGYLAAFFQIFADEDISIDITGTSDAEIGASFSDPAANLSRLIGKLETLGEVTIHNSSALVALVGNRLGRTRSLGDFFNVLHRHNIPVQQISKSPNDCSLWTEVPNDNYNEAVTSVYRELNL